MNAQTPSPQPVTPDRLVLANALLDAMDFDHTADRMAAMRLPRPDAASQAGFQGLQAFAKQFFTPQNLRPPTARAYAELFTDDELRELIKFYQSPAAKKLTELQPVLAQKNQEIVAQIIQEHMDDYLRIMSGKQPN